jgi:threonine dehydrogenase-like Zn-dependent dehydrogenase
MKAIRLNAKRAPREDFTLGPKDVDGTLTYLGSDVSTIVIVARADAKIPLTGEVIQVRRASIVGSQGHSGHGTFPRVIAALASGMDMTRLVTKKIGLEQVPENLTLLQTDRNECKITAIL